MTRPPAPSRMPRSNSSTRDLTTVLAKVKVAGPAVEDVNRARARPPNGGQRAAITRPASVPATPAGWAAARLRDRRDVDPMRGSKRAFVRKHHAAAQGAAGSAEGAGGAGERTVTLKKTIARQPCWATPAPRRRISVGDPGAGARGATAAA